MTRPVGRPNNLKSADEYERLKQLALKYGKAPAPAPDPAAAAADPGPDPGPDPAPAPAAPAAEKLKIIKPTPPARTAAYQRYQCGQCFEYLKGPDPVCPKCGTPLTWGAG